MALYSQDPDQSTYFNNPDTNNEANGLRTETNNNPDLAPDVPNAELEGVLHVEHQNMLLQGSGVSPKVVKERRYRTVESKAELRRLGFSDAQCIAPGLLFPIYSPTGEVANYQLRPDEPRIGKNGKPVKYETPRGSRMVLDVHPRVQNMLGDPSVPLYITEGIKKGDALVSRGLCAVCLLGVWNWRGTNDQGGKVALPEWEHIALNGRQVYVVFDSDVMLKPQVYAALIRLKGFLESRGAKVAVVYLPATEGGSKQGVDDFLAAGNSVEDLLSLATTELREPPRDEEDEAMPIPYQETSRGLVWEKHTAHGSVPVMLSNFTARITGDVVEDDGAVQSRRFEIAANLNGRRSVFEVPAEQFSAMGWPTEHLGASAILAPGFGLKDHARAAIQLTSGDVPRRYVYAHTGWREIDGGWVYLHAGGPIGPKGAISGIETALGEGRLGDYSLPVPPTGEELRQALSVSLRLLELAPPTITVPLLAAIYRAPLGEMVPVDLSLFLAGATGAYKTELTAIAQAHYGAAFNSRNMPANWTSTENAQEKQAFAAKDAIIVVDDFAPGGTTYEVARLHSKADRLLRAQGNRSGRGRMRADTTLRAEYYPRGLIISSGEDVPNGQSLRARMVVVELSQGDVDLEVLTELQKAAAEGVLASALSGYLRWLAPQMEDLKERLLVRRRELRAEAAGAGAHARTPDTVASLALGIEQFLAFAVESGAITDTRAQELWDEGWQALGEAAEAQAEHQAGEEPTRQFLDLLIAAIVAGDAHVANAKTGEQPEDAERWGWRSGSTGADEYEGAELQPRGKCIGWLSEDGSLLLEPGAAYAAAQRMARDQGTSLPIKKQTLYKRMAEKGLLASRDPRGGRNTTRATIDGERKTVVHLIAGALSPETGPNGPGPTQKGPSGPKQRAVSHQPDIETARDNGPNSAENRLCGPKGPKGPFPRTGSAEKVEGGARHLPDAAPRLVETEAGVRDLLPQLRKATRVALDLETTGLDPRKDGVRLLTLATECGTWIIDCFQVDPRPLFPLLAEKRLVIHNALFDLGMLSEMGFEMGEGGEVIDTMLLSQLLEGLHPIDKEEV